MTEVDRLRSLQAFFPGASLADLQQTNNASDPQQTQQIGAGQQYAQSSPIQMRTLGNGQVQVINIQTGQVLYTGSPAGAANAQANSAYQQRVRTID